jgi:hypothetical protein
MVLPNFSTFLPPTIVNTLNGRYICPGWISISEDVSLEDVYKSWTRKEVNQDPKPKQSQILEMVDSSTGKGKQYSVRFDGMWWNCDCPGFSFRKKCRHVDEVKLKYKA